MVPLSNQVDSIVINGTFSLFFSGKIRVFPIVQLQIMSFINENHYVSSQDANLLTFPF